MVHLPFRLEPLYQQRVWGGDRLQPGSTSVGEAWLVAPESIVTGRTMTLDELAGECGPELTGSRCAKNDAAVPVVVKLLDTSDWLSVQVHPTDGLAREIEGLGHCGKTETWHIISAPKDAEIIAGVHRNVEYDDFAAALKAGDPAPYLRHMPVRAGDTVHIPAGMVHALGPGLLVYEVQQSSKHTYRGYDWDRPRAAGRRLDIDRFVQAFEPGCQASVIPLAGKRPLISVAEPPPYRLRIATGAARLDTCGLSFHTVTAADGAIALAGTGWREVLEPLACLFIPADVGAYNVEPTPGARALIADVGP